MPNIIKSISQFYRETDWGFISVVTNQVSSGMEKLHRYIFKYFENWSCELWFESKFTLIYWPTEKWIKVNKLSKGNFMVFIQPHLHFSNCIPVLEMQIRKPVKRMICVEKYVLLLKVSMVLHCSRQPLLSKTPSWNWEMRSVCSLLFAWLLLKIITDGALFQRLVEITIHALHF